MSKIIDYKEGLKKRAEQKAVALHRAIDNATERSHLVNVWRDIKRSYPNDSGYDVYFRNALNTRCELKARELGLMNE